MFLPCMYLPRKIADAADYAVKRFNISEIRLRPDEKVIVFSDKAYFLTAEGRLSENDGLILSGEEFKNTFEKMCQHSVYAQQNNLRCGYLSLPGGDRVGVSGRAVVESGAVMALYDISSLNIRISRQVFSAADNVIEHIAPFGKVRNTLIISPPGCGKTTLLREVARLLGGGRYKLRVGIIDERCEIAAVSGMKYGYDVGYLSFVYSSCPKAEGMEMALRSMGPDVLVCDEIGSEADEKAVFSTVNAGVKVICSCHGFGREDVLRRGTLGSLMKQNIFEKTIVLSGRKGAGTVEEIY